MSKWGAYSLGRLFRVLFVTTALGTLTACGGSNGGLSSAPPPPPPPPDEGPAAEPTEAPEGPIGLTSNEPFAVLGVSNTVTKVDEGDYQSEGAVPVDISFEYRGSDGSYVITLPDYNAGALYPVSYSGGYNDDSEWTSMYGSDSDLLNGESGSQDARVFLRWPAGPLNPDLELTYTSWGRWYPVTDPNSPPDEITTGIFAYGIPTAASNMPKTGTATYNAEVIGQSETPYPGSQTYVDYITGTAQLRFDFGAGTLAGEMEPSICPWDCYSLGVYNFIETLYASGSTSFSGQFSYDGEAVPSWFEGSFNGPDAAELMARWRAPFTAIDIWGGGESYTGTMSGIWVGKKE